MDHIAIRRGVPILALAIILAACGRATADEPSSSPEPSERPSPSAPAEKPSERPSASPDPPSNPAPSRPASPAPTPVSDPEPVVVEHLLPMIGRVTADGVAVRWLPDLDSGVVNGQDEDLNLVVGIRLRTGDEVVVLNGPVRADGVSWYEVIAGSKGPAYVFRGWVSGEYLARVGDVSWLPGVLSFDGQGFPASASAHVPANTWLTVTYAATPMPGAATCTFELSVVGTDGERTVVVPKVEIDEATVGQTSAHVIESLVMAAEGQVLGEVTGDCSFAVTLTTY